MRISAYNLVTPMSGGAALITNLLSRTVLRVSLREVEFLHKLNGGLDLAALSDDDRTLIATLAEGLFIHADDFDELDYVRRMHANSRSNRTVKNVVIAPTMQCNMSCHYCFESRTEGAMCVNMQDRLVERVCAGLAQYEALHVQWFGGEPLLEITLIEALSQRFRSAATRLGRAYSAEIISNGFLLSEDVAGRLAANGIREVQVTLEGTKSFHDKVRFLPQHEPTFDRIIENIKTASRYLTVNVRVHVAPYNLDSVRNLIDYLGTTIPEAISRLYFSPLFNYRSEGKLGQYLIDKHKFLGSKDFASVQTELVRRAHSYGINTSDPLNASYGLCLAMLHGTEVIGPSGTVSKCYLDTSVASKAYAHLGSGTFRPEEKAKWDAYDFAEDPECRSCTFLPVCLGGCPSQRMHGASKETVCTPLKFNFHDQIRLAYGGDSLHDREPR